MTSLAEVREEQLQEEMRLTQEYNLVLRYGERYRSKLGVKEATTCEHACSFNCT
jgi:hypothetical protein